METSNQIVSDVLHHLDLADLMEEDYYDIIDHGALVGMIVGLLCIQMEFDEKFSQQVVKAAYVHDIGKLRLSKNLYGRDKQALEIESVKYMRMHAQLGMEMLKECNYPEDILMAVYHHHENYDGSGYPDNLAGDRIPLSARLLRVCDAFSALISDRPYRRAFDMDAAVEMMIEDNKTFDMKIFLEFLKLYHSEQFQTVTEFANQINAKQRYYRERS
ncbi:MAG: HD-GYP domain-containing protein [Lachnospiraceae bacterium]